jgi:uncharacterized protein (DUF58 family)
VDRLLSGLAALPAKIRRWLRPPRVLRPTRAGWIFLAIILGVGFAALNTGNNLLYLVLSLLLAFLVLSGVLSESALRGLQIKRRLPREIFVGRDNSILIEVTNSQKRVAAYAIVVEDRLRSAADGRLQVWTAAQDEDTRQARKKRRKEVEAAGRCFVLRVASDEPEARRYTLSPARRGTLTFSGFRVSTRFPFGLFLKYREFEAVEETLVYPEIVHYGAHARVAGAEAAGETSTRVGAGGTVASLREFVEGDSMRRVHWRSSLRRNSLLVIETEDERETEIEVRLRARNALGRGFDVASGFARAVSRAASEVVEHLQRGLAVALRTDAVYVAAEPGDRQRARLLAFLALVTPDGRGPQDLPR